MQETQADSIPGSLLEKEMSTHSNILAWRILWAEESGGLWSIRSQSQTRLKWLSTHIHIAHFGMKTVLMKGFPCLKFSLWQFSPIDYTLILSSSFSKQFHLKRYNKGTFQGKFKFFKFLLDSRESWSEIFLDSVTVCELSYTYALQVLLTFILS